MADGRWDLLENSILDLGRLAQALNGQLMAAVRSGRQALALERSERRAQAEAVIVIARGLLATAETASAQLRLQETFRVTGGEPPPDMRGM